MSQDALELLLSGVKDQAQRKEITTAYYAFASGDSGTFPVQFAVLLKAFSSSLKLLPAKIQKSLANETGSIRDALLSYQACLEKNGPAVTARVENDRVEELLDALKEFDERLTVHRGALNAERETIMNRIAEKDRLLEKLAAHRIICGLILSYLGGVLTALAFQHLLPLLLSFFSSMVLRL